MVVIGFDDLWCTIVVARIRRLTNMADCQVTKTRQTARKV